MSLLNETIDDLISFTGGKKYRTIYADPPWQFQNRTGKVAPEHNRLSRYSTMTLEEINNIRINANDFSFEKNATLFKMIDSFINIE